MKFKCVLLGILWLAAVLSAESFQVGTLNSAYITSFITKSIKKEFSYVKNLNISVEIKNDNILTSPPKNAAVIRCDLSKADSYLGKVLVDLFYENKEKQTIAHEKLYIKTSVEGDVYVSSNKIKGKSIIDENDIELRTISLSSDAERYYFDKTYIIGKQATKNIAKGMKFTDHWIQTVPDIQKGEQIEAILKGKNYELKVGATALEEGSQGDMIRLTTTLSKKIIQGEIVNEKNVIVYSH